MVPTSSSRPTGTTAAARATPSARTTGSTRSSRSSGTPRPSTVYRSWERVYHNTSYYNRGLLQSETLRDAQGTPVTSMQTTYRMVDTSSGTVADLTSLTASVFPELTTVEQRWHDANGDVAKSTEMDYAYDERGNLLRVDDLGEPGTAADDVTAEMTYPDCRTESDEFPWTQTPATSLVVRSGPTILQRRESDVPCDYAAAVEVRDYLDPTSNASNKVAVTNVCFVPVGGQTSAVIGPSKTGQLGANPCGDDGLPDDPGPGRYAITYDYTDPDRLGAFVTSTTDSYGMTETSTYDNRFGRLVSTTDPVGATTSYAYDDANRVRSITGPLEQGSGHPTIGYEYHPNAPVPWAMAKHVDAANPGTTIDTVAFVDGLARLIETKRDATIFQGPTASSQNRMIVADQVAFDAFGRPNRTFYEGVEPLGTPGVFNGELRRPARHHDHLRRPRPDHRDHAAGGPDHGRDLRVRDRVVRGTDVHRPRGGTRSDAPARLQQRPRRRSSARSSCTPSAARSSRC